MLLIKILEQITQNNEHPFRWDIKGFWNYRDKNIDKMDSFAVVIAKKDFKIGDELFMDTITGEIGKSGDLRVGIVDMEHPTKPYWIVNNRKIYDGEGLEKYANEVYKEV